MSVIQESAPLLAGMDCFHAATRTWFSDALEDPTTVQRRAWPVLAEGKSALLLAPTGSGKTLAAFMAAIDRLMFGNPPPSEGATTAGTTGAAQPRAGGALRTRGTAAKPKSRTRVVYISPLKALAVDVDRNLRAPLAGIQVVADRLGALYHLPRVGVRSGDTSAADRRQMLREPPEILITTPESLYLLLTSKSREALTDVETVIVDEIHAVAPTKRGVHLFLTLERLERLVRKHNPERGPLQRIGLSATQRPLEEMARLLGGFEVAPNDADSTLRQRAVEIIDASEPKQLDLRIETPVADMANLAASLDAQQIQTGPTSAGPTIPSIWPAIHPRLVELIRERRSTMIFVNSRRLAERMAAAINELAGEELALAHHGSIARAKRVEIEDRLKRGQLRAIVATSSMELGVDMGAVDLVIQIEAPPSVASGMQRIGRAGHHVGAPSSGVIFPKYRGDLLACSAAAQRMLRGEVESTRYPRNALDVLAQQIVAMVADESLPVQELYAMVRGAAPFAELPRSLFDGVLDMLSGRYPSDEFAELRPRITWDRINGVVSPRKGSQRLAILNGGTIPDRGLYGVFLATGGEQGGLRVGELDEEMVYETRAGDIFLLGASSWRVAEITRDRVLVTPAPGEPGKMPFWKGDGPGRPMDFGRAIGALSRELAAASPEAAATLKDQCRLDAMAFENLSNYVHDQLDATGQLPSDECLVVESFIDDLGDWRTVILSPFGARVHAPWAITVAARLRGDEGREIDFTWADDGIAFRIPQSDRPPAIEDLFPDAQDVEDRVVAELGSTALFAARFRENAARALLLPRRYPQHRTPLWMQRRKSADLLAVAARFERFPIMLETFRECLRDVFDVPGLKGLLADVQRQRIRVHQVETPAASPFAASLLFNYTANYLYQEDVPLAERRAAALALDHAQLRELLGTADYRSLLDADAIDSVVMELQRLDERHTSSADGVHDLLLHLGDLDDDELALRCQPTAAADGSLKAWVDELLATRRIVRVKIAGVRRLAAAEDAARFRDALGVALPPGLPEAFLASEGDPLGDLVSRYARTHGPFRASDVAARFGVGEAAVLPALERLADRQRVMSGEFLPGGVGREWIDAGVLRRVKSRSLAKVRKKIEPAPPDALARLLPEWQGITRPRRGLDGLLDAIEQLQGAPLPASDLEELILPARVADFQLRDLDELCTAGEVTWRGVESIGSSDGRIALYLADSAPLLAPAPTPAVDASALAILELLRTRGALFFDQIATHVGGFPNDVLDSLWQLVWLGHVTNDTLAPLRSRRRRTAASPVSPARLRRGDRRGRDRRQFRSRRLARLAGSEGRWSLFADAAGVYTPTQRQTAIVEQLLKRYGVLVRAAVGRELVDGGFSALYPILRAMEEAGKARRGYFVAEMGGAQFAQPGADESLRREVAANATADELPVIVLGASDPANPYGAILKWPAATVEALQLARGAGARVFLRSGKLIGYLGRTGRHAIRFSPDDPADEAAWNEAFATSLAGLARDGANLLITQIDGKPALEAPFARDLNRHGFMDTPRGLVFRPRVAPVRIED